MIHISVLCERRFKPDGNRIVTDSLDKHYKYSHTTEGMRHFFHVSQLNVEDTGNYTVEFSTGKNNTIVQLQLKVHGEILFILLIPY